MCAAQDPNQYDNIEEVDRRSDVRLLDSLIMTVQLNVRKLLQAGIHVSAMCDPALHPELCHVCV